MRRAISKKERSCDFTGGLRLDDQQRHSRRHQNGVDEKTAQAIYDEILDFANYAFNKAHAVCYAKVSLTRPISSATIPNGIGGAHDRVGQRQKNFQSTSQSARTWALRCCRRISTSQRDNFTVVKGESRFGLVAVKTSARVLSAK